MSQVKEEILPPTEEEKKQGDQPDSNGGLKRKIMDPSEDERKAERRAANRRSAFQSRQRRKILIEDLQKTVASLSKDNTELRNNSNQLQAKLEAATLENQLLRKQLAASPGSALNGMRDGQGGNMNPAAALLGAQGVFPPSVQSSQLFGALNQGAGSSGGGGSGGSSEAQNGSDPLLAARLALAGNQLRVGGINELSSLGESGNLSDQFATAARNAPSSGLAGVPAPGNANGGQLQQQLAMLLAGRGLDLPRTSNDAYSQQQFALLQALGRQGASGGAGGGAGGGGVGGGDDQLSQAVRALTQAPGVEAMASQRTPS